MKVVIYGAGGHGKVVLNSLRKAGEHTMAGWIDQRPMRPLMGVPVLGGEKLLHPKTAPGVIIAIGNNQTRAVKARLARQRGLQLVTVIDPQAMVAEDVLIGAGTVVMPGAIINPGARIGENVIINSGAIIEHDCVIGDHAHVSPGARLAGNVRVGDYTHIGIGATVIEEISIGEHTVIGAGAVVVRPIGDGVVAVGVPAKVIKENREKKDLPQRRGDTEIRRKRG
jgi:sugar O-acyltransferase (sialic acid O-acetyltransferase NeuD family)